MSNNTCTSETEVLELIAIGQWPRQASDELSAHVSGCDACADTVTVGLALRELADEPPSGDVPDAAAVWQRTQLRARQEAMRVASRPVLGAQLAAAVGVVAAIAAATAWLIDATPRPWVGAGVVTERVSALFAHIADLWGRTGGATADMPPWIAWAAAGVVASGIAVVGLALLVSTIADLASNSSPPRA